MNPPESTPPARTAGAKIFVSAWLLGFILVVAIQFIWKVPQSEMWHTDDGAHYISSGMIASWIRDGFGPPIRYALEYNAHYPQVGIGLWGPAFYALFGLGIALFGPGKLVAFALQAAVMASITALIVYACSRAMDKAISFAGGLTLIVLPISVAQSTAFGLDSPVGLALFAAALAFWRFVESGRSIWLVCFSIAALVGLLTKGNAIAIFLFAPIALALTRRFDLLRDWRTWLAASMVSAVSVPWYLYSYGLASQGFRSKWGMEFTIPALAVNLKLLFEACGPVLLALAVLGIATVVRSREQRRIHTLGLICLALAISTYLFQSIVPASLNARYLFASIPCLIVLAVIGAQRLMSVTIPAGRAIWPIGLTLLMVTTLVLLPFPEEKTYRGIGGAARVASRDLPERNQVVLIVGFDVVETAFMSEVAMSKPIRPSIWIVRGTRLLGAGGYNNFEYQPKFTNLDEVRREIDLLSIPMIVISTHGKISNWKHIQQVQEIVDRADSGWRLSWRSDGIEDVRIYVNERNGRLSSMPQKIRELSFPKRGGLAIQ
jgi:hypothetical protein